MKFFLKTSCFLLLAFPSSFFFTGCAHQQDESRALHNSQPATTRPATATSVTAEKIYDRLVNESTHDLSVVQFGPHKVIRSGEFDKLLREWILARLVLNRSV